MQTLTKPNHTWLAYANQDKCNHVDAIHNLGFISWSMGRNYKFSIGDIVYIFMSDERRVRFKMQVEAEGIKREDMDYCISLLPEDITYRLRFVSEYNGNLLGETELIKRGFKGGRSIQKPTCKESEYMDFIKSVFDSIKNTNSMFLNIEDRPMMVIDLFSGSYVSEYIGHEILNLKKEAKDGRYYGYCPPHDNIDIKSLGAPRNAESIGGVTVIYVQKQGNSNDREVIAFCENATIHSKPIIDKSLHRYLDKENGFCSYSIESDTMVNLMYEEPKCVIEINDYSNKMFRMQRFYKGSYPKLDKKLFAYLKNYLNKKNIDEDFSFQLKIQEVNETACLTIGDYSKEEPKLGTGSGSLCVNKNAKVSKKALLSAKYTCAGNHNHITFETAKGQPYMEGHHLIPCTYTNTKHYWDTLGVNIDCLENIVCLCPTCHRQIHYGSNKEKRILIEKLYNMKCKELKSVGITISLNDLFSLYSI